MEEYSRKAAEWKRAEEAKIEAENRKIREHAKVCSGILPLSALFVSSPSLNTPSPPPPPPSPNNKDG